MKDLTLPTPALPPISDFQLIEAAVSAGLHDEIWFGEDTPPGYEDCMPKLRAFAKAILSTNHEDGGRAEPVWCSCGDAIMPDTGAKCGVCASGVALGGEKGEAVDRGELLQLAWWHGAQACNLPDHAPEPKARHKRTAEILRALFAGHFQDAQRGSKT